MFINLNFTFSTEQESFVSENAFLVNFLKFPHNTFRNRLEHAALLRLPGHTPVRGKHGLSHLPPAVSLHVWPGVIFLEVGETKSPASLAYQEAHTLHLLTRLNYRIPFPCVSSVQSLVNKNSFQFLLPEEKTFPRYDH